MIELMVFLAQVPPPTWESYVIVTGFWATSAGCLVTTARIWRFSRRHWLMAACLTVFGATAAWFGLAYGRLTLPFFPAHLASTGPLRLPLALMAMTLPFVPHILFKGIRDSVVDAEREAVIQRVLAREREREAVLAQVQRQIVTIVGHELRTPVAVVLGYIQLVLGGNFGHISEALRPPLQSMESGTRRINMIVNRMLVLIRDQHATPFDVAAVVNGVLDSSEVYLTTRRQPGDVEIAYNYPDPIFIEADEDQVRTAVFEMINNAIKFTDKGGHVTVFLIDGGDHVAIEVQDTGIGIERRYHAQIFDPFFQVRMDDQRPYEGTGMGLAVVREVAHQHGGYVELESMPGEGTTVRLVLPKK